MSSRSDDYARPVVDLTTSAGACIQCRHYTLYTGYFGGKDDRCARLVEGGLPATVDKARATPTLCAPEGKWFEPKAVPDDLGEYADYPASW